MDKKIKAINTLLDKGGAEERLKKSANLKVGDPLKELIIAEIKPLVGDKQAQESAQNIVKVYLKRMGF